MKKLIPSSLIVALFFIGCGHVNKLAEFDIHEKGYLFKNIVDPEAADADIDISSPSTGNLAGDIVASIGESILSSKAKAKLRNAIDTDTLVAAVSEGLEETMATYLRAKRANSLEEDPDFIVETVLEDCKLLSGSSGIHVEVSAEVSIFDQASGKLIWQYSTDEDIPLRSTWVPTPIPVAHSAIEIYNAVQLTEELTEREIRMVVNSAAAQVGRRIGEVLREDLSEL